MYTARQEAGRGQHGRRWLSPPGVLTVSFVFDCAEAAVGTRLSLAAGLAVAHTVEDLIPGIAAGIKWPNDCHCRDRKLAGILCEARSRGDRLRCVVGIGLNVAPEWRGDEAFDAPRHKPPIDLYTLGLTDHRPLPILERLRDYLLEAVGLLRAGRWPALHAQLCDRDVLHGRALYVTTVGGEAWAGTGAGLDADGRLLLALADGGCRSIDAGTVTLHPTDTSRPTEPTDMETSR